MVSDRTFARRGFSARTGAAAWALFWLTQPGRLLPPVFSFVLSSFVFSSS